jgi:hypothetical protein
MLIAMEKHAADLKQQKGLRANMSIAGKGKLAGRLLAAPHAS